MPANIYKREIAPIVGKSLIGIESVLHKYRSQLVDDIVRQRELFTQPAVITGNLNDSFNAIQPFLAQHLIDTNLTAYLSGIQNVSSKFPESLWTEFELGRNVWSNRNNIPPVFDLFTAFKDEPRLTFPAIEEAARVLSERNVLTREMWDSVTDAERSRAFMITGEIQQETIRNVRNMLVQDIHEGTSLKGFREKVADEIEVSALGPARIENIYRTNVQNAFKDGRQSLIDDPIVTAVFPYQAYYATHDSRVRPEHLALETLGIQGTNIYRLEDPFWDHFSPPISYNCRCGAILKTIDSAARSGIKEAEEWLETGQKPPLESMLPKIPFQNEPGFGSRGRTGVLS